MDEYHLPCRGGEKGPDRARCFIRAHPLHRRHLRSIIHRQGAKSAEATPGSFRSAFICLIRVICVPSIRISEVPPGGPSPKDEVCFAPAHIAIGAVGLPPVDKKVVLGIDLFIPLH